MTTLFCFIGLRAFFLHTLCPKKRPPFIFPITLSKINRRCAFWQTAVEVIFKAKS